MNSIFSAPYKAWKERALNKNTKDKDIENQETEINLEDGDNVSEEILLEDETTELEEVKSDEDIIKDLEDQVLRAKAEV